jgi:hypothetical protein
VQRRDGKKEGRKGERMGAWWRERSSGGGKLEEMKYCLAAVYL